MNSLIYIHKGYSWYVPLALRNGRRFYGRDVHYIGDAYGCFVARSLGVRAHRLRDYHAAADEFAKIYRHHSTLGYEFELFCIQRWFVLTEFLKRNGRNSCVYLDTDVLLTRNLTELVRQTERFGLMFTGYSAHVCFVNRLLGLEELCRFISELYSTTSNEERLRAQHVKMATQHGGGGVSDMTMFWWMQKQRPDLIGDYSSIFGDSPIDVSLDDTRGFQEDEKGFKKMAWSRSQPSAITLSGNGIPMATVHHQGRSKRMLFNNYCLLEGRVCFATKFYCQLVSLSYKFCKKLWQPLQAAKNFLGRIQGDDSMNLLEFLRSAKSPRIGLRNAWKIQYDLLFRRREVRLNPTAWYGEISLRSNTGDFIAFEQVFKSLSYGILEDLQPIRTVIDAGANIGLSSIFFSNRLKSPRVVAIEPEIGNFNQAVKNTPAYGNIKNLHRALWYEAGAVKISNQETGNGIGFQVETVGAGDIRTVTIPEILEAEGWETVDLLKIDIEGAEKELFEHSRCKNWIHRARIIVIELHDWLKPGASRAFFDAISPLEDIEVRISGENLVVINRKLCGNKSQRIQNIAYHLAVSSIDSPYIWQAYLSALTARKFHPDIKIFLATDKASIEMIQKHSHPILNLVRLLDLGPIEGHNDKVRSRLVKIRAASLIPESFLLVDCDTAFLKPLPEFPLGNCHIAAAHDAHVIAGRDIFPDFLKASFDRLGWRHLSQFYLNSGVILVNDANRRGKFFEDWEAAYLEFLDTGLEIDQGAFNHTIDLARDKVAILPREWNAFVRSDERARRGAVIQHFFSSDEGYMESNYKKIVDALACGKIRDAGEVEERLLEHTALFDSNTISRSWQAGDWHALPELILKKVLRKIYGTI